MAWCCCPPLRASSSSCCSLLLKRCRLFPGVEGEEEEGPGVESGDGEAEPDSYWKRKEAFTRGSTVSLADLSARLLSVHAEKDSFVITFKTVEEIWKFSTYLALGSFFAKALVSSGKHSEEEEELCFRRNDLLMVRDTGQDNHWEGTLLSTGQHGLVPVNTMQPLPYPFYQWFLRKYPDCAGCSPSERGQFDHHIVTGSCEAVVDHNPVGCDELQLSRGDLIEIQGMLLRDRLDQSDFTYIRNQPKQEHKPHASSRQSIISEKSDATPPYHSSPRPSLSHSSPRPSFYASQNALGRGGDGELLSFSLDDTFREMNEFQEDPALFLEEGSWEGEESEVCDPTLTLLNVHHFQEDFLPLYDLHHSFLWLTFSGQSEEELLGHLEIKMADKLPPILEKASALLLCLPSHTFTSLDEFELLKLVLRRKIDDSLPFVERLQFLTVTLSAEEGRPIAPLDLNWLLSRLYHRKYMPYLALASLSLDSGQDHSLQDAFHRIELFSRNSVRLNPRWKEGTSLLPAQIVVYLQQALAIAERGEDLKTQRDLCLGLACVYQQHGALEKALPCAQQAVQTGGGINEEEGFEASVLLGWLLVLTGQPERAHNTLQPLLQSLQGTDSPTQRGVVHNLLALCLRRQGRVPEAGSHLHHALTISRESGNQRNQALALANLGCLALGVGAPTLAERFLFRSLWLFLEIWESPVDEEHVQTYLWLGRSYKDRGRSQDVRLCYEMGLLISLHTRNLHSQMVVAKVLSRHYGDVLLYGQSILYYEHCVSVSRDLKDKRLEGEYLEILSSLYLSLNTEKSSRKSLDYSKQSLRISIDLGKREEESETWLQVGRIYYLIHEDELADMYLQAAVKTALRMNDPRFAMSIYEEAGDVFFKGHRNRLASLPFYRDGSLPFARSIRDVDSEFRMLSKLTELLMTQEEHEEALQYAILAVQISTKTGVVVNERAAYHRLATVYYSLEQYEMTENYYLKSLSLSPADAYDSVCYFQLALAAALEDRANPQALYVVYMKLAEIHANHMPDPLLCQAYRDRAQSLRRELSGLGEMEGRGGETETEERGGEMEGRGGETEERGGVTCDTDLETRNTDMEETETETGWSESTGSIPKEAIDMDSARSLRLEPAGLRDMEERDTEGQHTGLGDMERGDTEGHHTGLGDNEERDIECQHTGLGDIEERDTEGQHTGLGDMEERETEVHHTGLGDMERGDTEGHHTGLGDMEKGETEGHHTGLGDMEKGETEGHHTGLGDMERGETETGHPDTTARQHLVTEKRETETETGCGDSIDAEANSKDANCKDSSHTNADSHEADYDVFKGDRDTSNSNQDKILTEATHTDQDTDNSDTSPCQADVEHTQTIHDYTTTSSVFVDTTITEDTHSTDRIPCDPNNFETTPTDTHQT
ncbi:unnamed protein product [Coregonus sp. 'balchen']|nr:unnamed protein product [Coregonus sp. 'balchen']